MSKHRMLPRERRAIILAAGLKVAHERGLHGINHATVAEACAWPTSVPTVWRLFGHTRNLTRRIIEHARRTGDGEVIAQADRLGI
jgi:DNA-binding transcriptional regulator YbjK